MIDSCVVRRLPAVPVKHGWAIVRPSAPQFDRRLCGPIISFFVGAAKDECKLNPMPNPIA